MMLNRFSVLLLCSLLSTPAFARKKERPPAQTPLDRYVAEAGGSLFPMAEQVCRAIAWVWRNAASFGGDPNRLYIGGQSSGAHLAAVAATTDWRGDYGLPADIVKGGLTTSGMYELAPVRLTAPRSQSAAWRPRDRDGRATIWATPSSRRPRPSQTPKPGKRPRDPGRSS